ncbi:MAG: LysM peptidoglycan-binding domain-containing protein [Actinomycetota bacterium]|nr:LysM peptidoglycan-binding domain-containing protein [Actinomycetota bacterium]
MGDLNVTESVIVVGVALLLAFATLALFRTQPIPEDLPVMPVVVGSADSLWSIARDYPLEGHSTARTVEALRLINGKSDSALSIGEILLVPATSGHETELAQR